MKLFMLIPLMLVGCAYGRGYWLFPDSHGYHFNPCLYPEKVRPQDVAWYNAECMESDEWQSKRQTTKQP